MKTKLIATAWCLCVFSFTHAQKDTSNYRYANITEAGIFAASPRGIGLEVTTVNGIAINKHHVIGIGFGIGASFHRTYSDYNYYYYGNERGYTPIFANYRYYFKPDNRFCPHITGALGGVVMSHGGGLYTAVSAGFRVNKFSFSSGISFMPVRRMSYFYPDYGYFFEYDYRKSVYKWHYPFGFMIKCGFSF